MPWQVRMPGKEPSPLEILKDQVGEITRHLHRLTESIAGVRERVGRVEGQLEGERRLHQSKQRNWTLIFVGATALFLLASFIIEKTGQLLGWWS